MKLKLALLFCLAVLMSASARNYKTIVAANTSHYGYPNDDYPGQIYYNTISIDSTVASGGGLELFNFTSFQDSSGWNCYPANRVTWIAAYIFQTPSGDEYYSNTDGQTIHFMTQAGLNATWHLYDFGTGPYILATVTDISMQNFIGLSDTVKTIQLTAKDTAGNTIAHPLNGKEIKLSEHYGFVQTLAYRYFPLDTVIYNLSGIDNLSAGIKNLTAKEIFDFNVNDEFHGDDDYRWAANMDDHYYYIKRILAKSFSADSDTVFYTVDHCYRHESLNDSVYNVYTGHDTITESYVISDASVFNQYSWQMKDTSAAVWTTAIDEGYLIFSSDPSYLGRLKKMQRYYYAYNVSQNCFNVCLCDPPPPDVYYAAGLGWIAEDNYFSTHGRMVYYKKGTEEWGIPLDCSILISVDAVSNKKNLLTIYPDPVPSESEITFTYPASSAQREIILNDINGKETARYSLPQGSSVYHAKLPQMHGGVYVARLVGSGAEGNVKFVVE